MANKARSDLASACFSTLISYHNPLWSPCLSHARPLNFPRLHQAHSCLRTSVLFSLFEILLSWCSCGCTLLPSQVSAQTLRPRGTPVTPSVKCHRYLDPYPSATPPPGTSSSGQAKPAASKLLPSRPHPNYHFLWETIPKASERGDLPTADAFKLYFSFAKIIIN